MIFLLRHSTKLHIFGARASTVAVISRTILAFSFAAYDSYHFVSLVLPWRLTNKRKLIMAFLRPRGALLAARRWCAGALPWLVWCGGARGGCLRGRLAVREKPKMSCSHRALLQRARSQNTALGLCLLVSYSR